jgi:DNA-binding transcriptional LysR family regulator
MINGLDYRYLRAFYLTAKHLNFSKAAGELAIAQSAVSRQIKLLEESIEDQLIIRSSKRVILTEKGKNLFLALQHFEELTREITESEGSQLIRVGILHGLLENWFIKVIKTYCKKSKNNLKIEVDTPANLKQSLIDGKADLIFTTENIQSDLITSLRLFEERLVIISKHEIDIKKINEYPWITYNESDFFFDLYKKHSKQIITVSSITSIIKLVKEGVGVAIVPEHTLKNDERLWKHVIKGIKRPQIHLGTLNYQNMPKFLNDLITIVKKSI